MKFDRGFSFWKYVGPALALVWLIVLALVSADANFLPDPLQLHFAERLHPPGAGHWFGTDELGRDIFSRISHAARFTLLVTVGATLLSLGLGFLFGSVAAWFGRAADAIVLLLINLFWSIPMAVFAVLIVAIVGVNAWSLIFAIGGVNWVSSARIFRSEMLRLRRENFVTASRAFGFSPLEIFIFQILPNLKATGVSMLGYAAAETVALESGLAFLGLSVPAPTPSWGGMMADGLALLSSNWWVAGIPALAVTGTLMSIRSLAITLGNPPQTK